MAPSYDGQEVKLKDEKPRTAPKESISLNIFPMANLESGGDVRTSEECSVQIGERGDLPKEKTPEREPSSSAETPRAAKR